MTLEERTNKWTLRVFESLWAIQVNFLASDIAGLGLERFLAEHKAYAIGYGIIAVAYLGVPWLTPVWHLTLRLGG